MEEIRRSLNSFIYGDLSFDDLREQLGLIVAASPDMALEVSMILDQLHGEGWLPTGLHKELGDICVASTKGVLSSKDLLFDRQEVDPGKRITTEGAQKANDKAREDSHYCSYPRAPGAPDEFAVTKDSASAETDQSTDSAQPDADSSIDEQSKHADAPDMGGHGKKILKNRFVLEEHIATGGMGVIYKALDLRKDELQDKNPFVAIKILNEDFKAHPDALISLQREAAKVQKLAHPNIVTVYDFDRDGDTVFMTMEYLDGKPLSDLIKQSGSQALPRDLVMQIIAGVSRGLVNAHSKGIIHADLKPSNVFLTNDGVVKLLDFGIARAVKSSGEESVDITLFNPQSLGALTPSYASMEMFNNEGEPDPRDDIYGLACLSYELLSGQHPFKKLPSTTACAAKLKPDRIVGLSRKQWAVLSGSLAFERSKRTPSVIEFLDKFIGKRSDSDTRKSEPVISSQGVLLSVVAIAAVIVFIFSDVVRSLWPLDSEQTKKSEKHVVAQTQVEKNRVEKKHLLKALEINEVVELGQVQVTSGNFLKPSGANAFETFNQVLKLDPQNTIARQQIDAIAGSLLSSALEKKDAGEYRDSLKGITRALQAYPEHGGLLALQEDIEEEIAVQEKQAELTQLFTRAKQQFLSMQLTNPPGNNAFETYRKVLLINPRSEMANEGVASIAAHYEATAKKRRQFGELRGSLEQINRGLKVLPQHEGLLALRERVQADLVEQVNNNELDSLLERANRQFLSMQLTDPANDNAYQTYKLVLSKNPLSKRAVEGLNRIADKYFDLAVGKQRQGDFRASLVTVEKGLTVVPKHASLLRLKENISDIHERLADANQRMADGELVEPIGYNALSIYKQILRVDPENLQAITGINLVSDELEKRARIKLNDGDLQEGLFITNNGLKYFPKNRGLIFLRAKFEQMIAARKETESKMSSPILGTF